MKSGGKMHTFIIASSKKIWPKPAELVLRRNKQEKKKLNIEPLEL